MSVLYTINTLSPVVLHAAFDVTTQYYHDCDFSMLDAWQQATENIEKVMSEADFGTWIKPVHYSHHDGRTVFLSVPMIRILSVSFPSSRMFSSIIRPPTSINSPLELGGAILSTVTESLIQATSTGHHRAFLMPAST